MNGFCILTEALTMADLKTCNARLVRLASIPLYRWQEADMKVEGLFKIKDAYEVRAIEQAELVDYLMDLIPGRWTRLLAFVIGAASGAAASVACYEIYARCF